MTTSLIPTQKAMTSELLCLVEPMNDSGRELARCLDNVWREGLADE